MNRELTTRKFVAVLNEKIPVGVLMNALGHMAAGIVGGASSLEEMRFDSYFDKDGGEHRSISDCPFIILKAENSSQIRRLRQEFASAEIKFVDFTSTMTV